jgi:hypothetical protein
MERTLKESEALKQCQHAAEELEGYGDVDVNAQIAIVWSLIAVHEVLDRLVDTLNDLPLESINRE